LIQRGCDSETRWSIPASSNCSAPYIDQPKGDHRWREAAYQRRGWPRALRRGRSVPV